MLLHLPPFSERRLARGRGANNVPNIASCVLLRNPSRIDHKHWSPAPILLLYCHSGAGCSVPGAGSGSTRAGLMANMCAHFLSGACSILGATRDQARQCARVRRDQTIMQRMPQSIEQGPAPSGCRRQRRRWQPKKARRREAARPRPQQSNGDGMEQSARRHERSAPRQRLTATAAPISAYAERLLRVAAAFMVGAGVTRTRLSPEASWAALSRHFFISLRSCFSPLLLFRGCAPFHPFTPKNCRGAGSWKVGMHKDSPSQPQA